MTSSHYKDKKYVARNSQCFHPDLGTAVAPFAGPAPSGRRGSATSQTLLRIPPDIVENRSSRRHPLSSLQKPTQADRLRSGRTFAFGVEIGPTRQHSNLAGKFVILSLYALRHRVRDGLRRCCLNRPSGVRLQAGLDPRNDERGPASCLLLRDDVVVGHLDPFRLLAAGPGLDDVDLPSGGIDPDPEASQCPVPDHRVRAGRERRDGVVRDRAQHGIGHCVHEDGPSFPAVAAAARSAPILPPTRAAKSRITILRPENL